MPWTHDIAALVLREAGMLVSWDGPINEAGGGGHGKRPRNVFFAKERMPR